MNQNILWHKAQSLKGRTNCWRTSIPRTWWIQKMTGQICERIISSTQKYLLQFFWVTDIWGHGVCNRIPTTLLFIPSHSWDWHILNLLKAQTLSIIDFPLFTLSGEGFLCGARGLLVSEKRFCILLPVPCVTQGIPGAQHCGVSAGMAQELRLSWWSIMLWVWKLSMGASLPQTFYISENLMHRECCWGKERSLSFFPSYVMVWFLTVRLLPVCMRRLSQPAWAVTAGCLGIWPRIQMDP